MAGAAVDSACRVNGECAEGYLCLIEHFVPSKSAAICAGGLGACVEAPAGCAKANCDCAGSVLCGISRCWDFSSNCVACMDP
jgi:hypothetical protein